MQGMKMKGQIPLRIVLACSDVNVNSGQEDHCSAEYSNWLSKELFKEKLIKYVCIN